MYLTHPRGGGLFGPLGEVLTCEFRDYDLSDREGNVWFGKVGSGGVAGRGEVHLFEVDCECLGFFVVGDLVGARTLKCNGGRARWHQDWDSGRLAVSQVPMFSV